MARWSDIEPGDVIQGKDHMAWEVTDKKGAVLTLVRKGKAPVVGSPTGDVVRLLSARIIADPSIKPIEVEGIHQVPVEYAEIGALKSHVYILHGRNLEGDYLPELVKVHAGLHHPDIKSLEWIAHHHTPEFLKGIS